MKSHSRYFAPKNQNEEEIFAVEGLIFDVQIALQAEMKRRGISQKDLASMLGVSSARVSQLFNDDGANLTLATVAKIAHALKVQPRFSVDNAQVGSSDCGRVWETLRLVRPSVVWKDTSANKNVVPIEIAA